MTKWKKVLCWVLLAVFLAGVSGCSKSDEKLPKQDYTQKSDDTKIQLYYVDQNQGTLTALDGVAEGSSLEEQVQSILDQLKETSLSGTMAPAIPDDVQIQSFAIHNGVVELDMSENYAELKNGTELLCRGALIWSLTSLKGVDGATFTANGKIMSDSTGTQWGTFNRGNFLVNESISPEPTTMVILALYFANSDSTALAQEEREVAVAPGQTEKAVVEQLIAGPTQSDLKATVPPETRIRSVTVSDGICYVDLSSEFISKYSGGTEMEALTVYSIVNSLCALDSVKKVQFLIEGEKRAEFKGTLDFSQPFEAKAIGS